MPKMRNVRESKSSAEAGVFLSLKQLRIGWFPICLLVLLAAWATSGIAFSSLDLSEAIVGFGITLLCSIPSILWLRSKTREFPAFQLFCLSIFLYYGRPILAGHPEYMRFEETTRFWAGFEVLTFLIIAIGIYYGGFRRVDLTPRVIQGKVRLLSPNRAKTFFAA